MKRLFLSSLLALSISHVQPASAGFMAGIIHERVENRHDRQTFVGFEDKGKPGALNQGEPPKTLDTSFVWGSRVREWLAGWYSGTGQNCGIM